MYFDAHRGTVTFTKDARGCSWPEAAVVTIVAEPATLNCRIDASAEGQVDDLKGTLARQIERFAFGEAPPRFYLADEK